MEGVPKVSMTLPEIMEFANAVAEDNGLDYKFVETFGGCSMCLTDSKEIWLEPLTETVTWRAKEIILHEIAHALHGKKVPDFHDSGFYRHYCRLLDEYMLQCRRPGGEEYQDVAADLAQAKRDAVAWQETCAVAGLERDEARVQLAACREALLEKNGQLAALFYPARNEAKKHTEPGGGTCYCNLCIRVADIEVRKLLEDAALAATEGGSHESE